MDLVNSSIITVGTATVEFALSTKYSMFLLRIRDLTIETDSQELQLRVSHDAGVSFDSASSSYRWTAERIGPTGAAEGSATDTRLPLASPGVPVGNAAGEGMNSDVYLYGANITTDRFQIAWQTSFLSAASALGDWLGNGRNLVNGKVNAIQLSSSSGNINTARIYLYGITGNV
jgi:hypothetical protein